ncbi:granzyme A-like [Nelusetta ayraudi]|uniref:granzyme A-like n=1 Tax=Nelusetta ayraudi TaxID=303726 RepID=UPI003F6F6306
MSVPGVFILSVLCVLLLSVVQPGDGSEIIGGKEVPAHSMPHMALLKNSKGFCGGTLIDAKWVLTAAHCEGFKEVLLGVHAVDKEENESRQKARVTHSYPHPCFDRKEAVNDLMLLKLKKGVKQTKTVKWLKLGQKVQEPKAGSKCLVAGWGATGRGKPSKVLMSVNVTVFERVKCNSPEYYNFKPVITNSMICAGSDSGTPTDTCQGDSGGPLLCNGALVGVTSFGGRCGDMKKPGVYSFLSEKQLDWIKKTMKKKAEVL